MGILIEPYPGSYSRDLRRAVNLEASCQGIHLEFIPTPWVSVMEEATPSGADQTLRAAESCDGLLLFTSVFETASVGLTHLVKHWLPRPVVSIGAQLPGVDTVLLDNQGGSQTATEHLIVHHHRRKILFIRGRADSQEAERRYLGYRRGLNKHRILYDAKKVLQADFTAKGARAALSGLAKDVEYDGIVAANDDMALGALDYLRSQGRVVPKDVSVIGFDDVPDARKATVPLASLAQPFEQLARISLGLLVSPSDAQRNVRTTSVPVVLTPRTSCGCIGG